MRLTLTREQIPSARRNIDALRSNQIGRTEPGAEFLPGYEVWFSMEDRKPSDVAWADALEAAIADAERDVKPDSDADERAFWREVFAHNHVSARLSVRVAADEADEALARYRKAFGGEA